MVGVHLRQRIMAVVGCIAMSIPGLARPTTALDAGEPQRQVGLSYLVAGSWFQYLGKAEEGPSLWLYPHLDGIFEVFTAREGPISEWIGLLGSRFDPESGEFSDRFHAAELLNEFLGETVPKAKRVEAARLLLVFIELRGGCPYYLEKEESRIRRRVRTKDLAWVERTLAAHRGAVGRVERPGTLVPGLSRARLASEGPAEYYRRMVADGYLDVAIIGGNLHDAGSGKFRSWTTVEDARKHLDELGFSRKRLRGAEDAVLSVHTVYLLGQQIRVRVLATGGSQRPCRIRRATANFVEGLAHADVVLYHGHSNVDSGAYYTSELPTPFARFRIGLGASRDLEEKCHSLGTKAHQIIAFQSCSSYEKYCRPFRWYLEKAPQVCGHVGFLGNADIADMGDFAPRFGKFLELLLEGRGARDIGERLNRIRPADRTPPLVVRGVLQPRFSFVVPEEVEVVEYRELDAGKGNLVVGTGSDGRQYFSTEVFPQNSVGEIVQVAGCARGLLGLRRDGILMVVERDGGGAARETRLSREKGGRFRFVGEAPLFGSLRILLVGTDGTLYVLDRKGKDLEKVRRSAPEGVRFRAVGGSDGKKLVAEDEVGRWYEWDRTQAQFRKLKSPPTLTTLTPSLLGAGGKARLWTPEAD